MYHAHCAAPLPAFLGSTRDRYATRLEAAIANKPAKELVQERNDEIKEALRRKNEKDKELKKLADELFTQDLTDPDEDNQEEKFDAYIAKVNEVQTSTHALCTFYKSLEQMKHARAEGKLVQNLLEDANKEQLAVNQRLEQWKRDFYDLEIAKINEGRGTARAKKQQE